MASGRPLRAHWREAVIVLAGLCLCEPGTNARAESLRSLWQRLSPPADQIKPGPWAVHVYAGKLIDSPMTRLHYAPWSVQWSGATIVGVNVHRRIVTFWKYLDLEVEAGVARRFQERAWEVHAALTIRWDGFFWNRHVYTTVAVSPLGPSYVDRVSYWERKSVGFKRNAARLANVFSTELTLALPQYRNYPLVLRVHHRSQIFGLHGGNRNGVQFATIGFRVHF